MGERGKEPRAKRGHVVHLGSVCICGRRRHMSPKRRASNGVTQLCILGGRAACVAHASGPGGRSLDVQLSRGRGYNLFMWWRGPGPQDCEEAGGGGGRRVGQDEHWSVGARFNLGAQSWQVHGIIISARAPVPERVRVARQRAPCRASVCGGAYSTCRPSGTAAPLSIIVRYGLGSMQRCMQRGARVNRGCWGWGWGCVGEGGELEACGA